MKAWIIYLEGTETPVKVISILSSRLSGDRVLEYVEQIFVDRFLSKSERLEYVKKNKRNIVYPAELGNNEIISCGYNPFVFAMKASDAEVIADENGEGKFRWKGDSGRVFQEK